MSKGKTKTGKQHPIKSIKRAAAPLCCFETADPASTIKGICDALNELNKGETPIAQWDCARGLTGLNDEGTNVVVTGAGNPDPQFPLDQVLNALGKITGEGNVTVFIHNAHRFITGESAPKFVQEYTVQKSAIEARRRGHVPQIMRSEAEVRRFNSIHGTQLKYQPGKMYVGITGRAL
jgi:hypothetical protein